MAATSSNCLAVVLKELGWSYTSRLGEASPRPPWAVQHPGGRPAPSPVSPLRHRRARAARSAAPTTGPAWAAMALWIAAHCSSTCFRSRLECARTRTAWSQACCALVGNIAIPRPLGPRPVHLQVHPTPATTNPQRVSAARWYASTKPRRARSTHPGTGHPRCHPGGQRSGHPRAGQAVRRQAHASPDRPR
jgi:hypothetical protein